MFSSKQVRLGEYKFAQTDLTHIDADGTFSGYASLFGAEDLGRDVLMPGAFRNSLKKQGADGVRMLFQHDPNVPIGVWDIIREDDRGLYVKGRLTLDVEKAREVHALMLDGGLNGLSIGFKTIKGKRDQKTGVRQIFEVDLWEISVVTFPMLPEAKITSVKTAISKAAASKRSSIPTTREFERWLTRDAGLTRKQARVVIHSGFKSLGETRDALTTDNKTRRSPAAAIRAATLKMRASKTPRSLKGLTK
ncbi:MAG: HK97 family phage prohead protease [Hyphomicrobiales bacterium]